MVRGEGLHTNPTSPSPSGFPSLRSCLDSHRELIYVREKKAHETSPGIQFAICRVLSRPSIDYHRRLCSGLQCAIYRKGQYCNLFDRTFFSNKIRDLVIKKANDVSIYKNLSFFFSFSYFLSFSCLLSLFLFIYISIYLFSLFLSFFLSISEYS